MGNMVYPRKRKYMRIVNKLEEGKTLHETEAKKIKADIEAGQWDKVYPALSKLIGGLPDGDSKTELTETLAKAKDAKIEKEKKEKETEDA